MTAGRQWRAAVEDPDIVEPEKAAFVEIAALAVFAIDPPAEVRRQLAKDPLQEFEIGLAAQCLLGPVEKDRGPTVHRWIDITEIPFIGWDLSGWMQVKPEKQQVELLLGKIDVDRGERNGVKRQIPSGEPRIFPFIRHRDDMAADHVEPLVVPDPAARPSHIDAVLLEPFVYIVKEILLAPQHAGQRLSHHIGCIVAGTGRGDRPIELVGLAPARLEDLRKADAKWSRGRRCGIAQP